MRRQQCLSVEWYTPPLVIEKVRRVFDGEITTDPASCSEAQKTVKALMYYDLASNGLHHSWWGNVWLNPPYGGLQVPFIQKLAEEFRSGRVTQAITCLNPGALSYKWFEPLLEIASAHAVWPGRINFYQPGRDPNHGSPNKGTIFHYVGPNVERFATEFGDRCTMAYADTAGLHLS
ncbi:MAG TPA: DNA N-6-adenine-methyltransferase [Candidatus Baltobacteraceae bacterium]|jgi:hypothetical protein|nr:DNA N-6-adenine-methyltransferase [Candidatus Baltobacteraceae bacterium]